MPHKQTSRNLLSGLRVVEFASFVAGPSAGLALSQLGAEVIRVDPLGGAADFTRWPLSQRSGDSLFWNHLNRGKRSIELDTRSAEGRELLIRLVTAKGRHGGILIDNSPHAPWLDYEQLAARRADVIRVHIQGQPDGGGAVDYTVNPAVGVPGITGHVHQSVPVNHALPAWDLLTGMTAATALLAAVRTRDQEGRGADLKIALADVALSGVANLGWLTEADEVGHDRQPIGNFLYGSFGVDFETSDRERVMVVALTARQWNALIRATGMEQVFATLSSSMNIDWLEEGQRFEHRELIASILKSWFSRRSLREVATELAQFGVLWSKYRAMTEAIAEFRSRDEASVLADIEQPGIGEVVAARSPVRLEGAYGQATAAPSLGEDTGAILESYLGLDASQIGQLASSGVIRQVAEE